MLPYDNGNVFPYSVGADSISARGIWRQHKHPFLIHSLPPPRGGLFYFPSYRTILPQKVYSPCRKSTFLRNFCKVSAPILPRYKAQIFHTAEFFSILSHPARKPRSTVRNVKLYKDTCKFSATPAIEKKCTAWYTKHDNYRALPGRARGATTHAKQEENYGKKRNRRSVRRSHFGH